MFSFVDRERTALAHVTNPTEAALAQLYAHIQSLPESSKKKKLIKQFNKENGQGTPLQVNVRRKNHLRSKSLGDSIKVRLLRIPVLPRCDAVLLGDWFLTLCGSLDWLHLTMKAP